MARHKYLCSKGLGRKKELQLVWITFDEPSIFWYNTRMKKEITTTIVDREGLIVSPDTGRLVMGFTPHQFFKVGELYVSTKKTSYGFSVTTEPFGNARNIVADTAWEAAEKVADDYENLLDNGKRLNLPIPQSYIDRFGTGME